VTTNPPPAAMEVETLSGDDVRDSVAAVERAHQQVGEAIPANRDDADSPEHWQAILEANAAAVIGALEHVSLTPGYVVRYRFYGRQDGEARVRPFVARASTDVDAVRAALDWHTPPDSGPVTQRLRANRDADLLYKHFSFADSALGVFQYWLAMQEIWASAAWVHTRVVADRADFAELVSGADWQVEREVESYQPVVVRRPDGANLAALLYSPLQRHAIVLQQVEIQADNALHFAAAITVASGPRGYLV
jgi:hypothetical protein